MTREEAIAILEVSKHMATSGRMYNQAIDMAIEALDKKSADAVHKPDYSYEADMVKRLRKEDFDKWADDIKKQNKSQAEAVQGWISCSERLPDIDTSVIICTASGNITDGYRWNEKDWFLAWSEYNGWHEGNDEGRITAWMPLPKPYKGGDTE